MTAAQKPSVAFIEHHFTCRKFLHWVLQANMASAESDCDTNSVIGSCIAFNACSTEKKEAFCKHWMFLWKLVEKFHNETSRGKAQLLFVIAWQACVPRVHWWPKYGFGSRCPLIWTVNVSISGSYQKYLCGCLLHKDHQIFKRRVLFFRLIGFVDTLSFH